MSTRGGEENRSRSQKHQNRTKWNAYNKFKTDQKSKLASSVNVTNCCAKCTDQIEWKIKYGKYKPLSQPTKCTKCSEKRIKSAYHILCKLCVKETGFCAKCGQKEDLVNEAGPSKSESDKIAAELQKEVKGLPERKRRTFLRYLRQQENKAKFEIRMLKKENSNTKESTEECIESIEEEAPKSLFQVHQAAQLKLKELTEKYGKEEDFDIDFDSDLEDKLGDIEVSQSEDDE